MTTPGLTINIAPAELTSTERKNAFAILSNLPSLNQFNRIKDVLNLTIPDVLGPTTLATFLRFCVNAGFDLSSEGVRAFKKENGLDPDKPILEVTATTYYAKLGFDLETSEIPWMKFAKGQLAERVKEFPGERDNPRIVLYHKSTNLSMPYSNEDETHWCSSFVNWCMMKADIRRTKSAAAKSWLKWGDSLDAPTYGCVVVLNRGSDPALGHVGFFVKQDADEVWLLGGNQGDAVSISRFPKSKVAGYRFPKNSDRLSD